MIQSIYLYVFFQHFKQNNLTKRLNTVYLGETFPGNSGRDICIWIPDITKVLLHFALILWRENYSGIVGGLLCSFPAFNVISKFY